MKRAILVLVAALALTAPAHANVPVDVTEERSTAAAMRIAERHWGESPQRCAGSVAAWLHDHEDPSVGASANDRDCVIWVDPDPWGYGLRESDPVLYCNLIVHEWGHLLGRAHSDDPHDVMFSEVPRTAPGCADPLAAPADPPATAAKSSVARRSCRASRRSRRAGAPRAARPSPSARSRRAARCARRSPAGRSRAR